MILLDTNVISEIMKKIPAPAVIHWLDQQKAHELFISTITVAEILYGINVLPEGNRKQSLEEAYNNAIKEAFKHRVLSFDQTTAFYYGKIMATRKSLGRPLSILDGQIAAIALQNGAVVATRNIRDFEDCNLELINPFI